MPKPTPRTRQIKDRLMAPARLFPPTHLDWLSLTPPLRSPTADRGCPNRQHCRSHFQSGFPWFLVGRRERGKPQPRSSRRRCLPTNRCRRCCPSRTGTPIPPQRGPRDVLRADSIGKIVAQHGSRGVPLIVITQRRGKSYGSCNLV